MIADAFALPRAELKTIGLVALSHVFAHLYLAALAFSYIPIVMELGVSSSGLAVFATVNAIAAGAALFPAGILADRIGAGPVVVAGVALPAAALTLTPVFPGYWPLMGFGLLCGLGHGAVWSAGYVVLATCIGAERRGRAFGIRDLFASVGMIAAPWAMLSLFLLTNWRIAFSIVGLVGIMFAAVAMRFRDAFRDNTLHQPWEPRNPERTRIDSRTAIAAIASSPVLLFLLAMTFLGFSGIGGHELVKESEELMDGLRAIFVGAWPGLRILDLLSLVLGLLFLILTPLAGGVMADKVKNREKLVAICLVASAILLGIGALDILPVPIWVWIGLGGLLAALASPSIDLLVLKICPSGRIGAVFGFVTTGGSIGGALALWGSRGLTGFDMPETVLWVSALALLLGVVSIYGARAVAR